MRTTLTQVALGCISLLALHVSPAVADRIDAMISPVSNPVNFDDPRAITEARPMFIHQELGDDFVTGGGDFQVYGLQLRYAVNDRLALLATKDGYIDFNPKETLTDENGFANLSLGAKYAFYLDRDAGQIVTGGLRYEPPTGNRDVFQGNDDGIFQSFVTSAVALDETITFIGATGLRIPVNHNDSTFWDVDIHLDKKFGIFYPLVEMNLVHCLDGGRRLGIADEGFDLINFGASGATGRTVVTGAAGGRVRVSDNVDLGLAYQFPLTSGKGSEFLDWRITSDIIISM